MRRWPASSWTMHSHPACSSPLFPNCIATTLSIAQGVIWLGLVSRMLVYSSADVRKVAKLIRDADRNAGVPDRVDDGRCGWREGWGMPANLLKPHSWGTFALVMMKDPLWAAASRSRCWAGCRQWHSGTLAVVAGHAGGAGWPLPAAAGGPPAVRRAAISLASQCRHCSGAFPCHTAGIQAAVAHVAPPSVEAFLGAPNDTGGLSIISFWKSVMRTLSIQKMHVQCLQVYDCKDRGCAWRGRRRSRRTSSC